MKSKPEFNLSITGFVALLDGGESPMWRIVKNKGNFTAVIENVNHDRWYVQYYLEELHAQYTGNYTPPPFEVSSTSFAKHFAEASRKGHRNRNQLRWFKYAESGKTWMVEQDSRSPNVSAQCVGGA